jgi:hypothetical protein
MSGNTELMQLIFNREPIPDELIKTYDPLRRNRAGINAELAALYVHDYPTFDKLRQVKGSSTTSYDDILNKAVSYGCTDLVQWVCVMYERNGFPLPVVNLHDLVVSLNPENISYFMYSADKIRDMFRSFISLYTDSELTILQMEILKFKEEITNECDDHQKKEMLRAADFTFRDTLQILYERVRRNDIHEITSEGRKRMRI